jgi:hypothetical protein
MTIKNEIEWLDAQLKVSSFILLYPSLPLPDELLKLKEECDRYFDQWCILVKESELKKMEGL